MELWAFGTSPYGLGLAPEAFWCLTQWEYDALRLPWAHEQARFANAHFNADGTPWIADDFMGWSTREQRHQQVLRDKAAVIAERRRLSQMRKGEIYDDIPDWAFGRKGRPDGRQCNRRSKRNDNR